MIRENRTFHLMAKPTGPICNLDCSYCFYLDKERLYDRKTNWEMSAEILENYIKQYIESQPTDSVVFVWQGGEATLLGVDFFKKVVELQNKYSDGKSIENTFQTYGVLINDEWCSFFAENNFLIGLSIDGPELIHDKYRVYKGGHPSFQKVIKGLELLKEHKVDFNTLTCVQKDNSYKALDIYNFLKEVGSSFMQFIPIIERKAIGTSDDEQNLIEPDYKSESVVTDWSVEPLQYGKFLKEIFDEWVKNDVGKYFIQIFDVALELWFRKKSSLCLFNETCGEAMAIEHKGDMYSCGHFVYPENKLGNIIEEPMIDLFNSEQQNKFGKDKRSKLPQYCLDCEVRFACNGECPKNCFLKTPDGEDGLNYLCEGYKYFFNYVNPYMKFMSTQLKPSSLLRL